MADEIKKIIALLFLAIFIFNTGSFAQKNKKGGLWRALNSSAAKDSSANDYYGDNHIRYEDYVYKKSIRSVELRDPSFMLSQPILNLDSDEGLKLSFDDLSENLRTYAYTIIQCNADWQPSDLSTAEYIDGFQDNTISDYHYSFNSLQKYVHYNATFPNSSSRITKSGNYILKVYADGDPETIVITRRFVVYQSKIAIECRVLPASIIEDRNYKQELDFTIKKNGYAITNPYADLKIVITQNNRWDNAKTDLNPVYVKDDELIYDYDKENVFDGDNEFRNFDMKSIRYHSPRIYKIATDSMGIQVTLTADEKRTFKRYTSQSDMNGNYLIKMDEANNSEVEGDYCYVHFFLPCDAFSDGNLYVFGAYNSWKCNPENLMHYNPLRMGYECSLYLKQGYYNYEYAFLKDGMTIVDNTLIEGAHSETENDYTIYVYHRPQGTFYDQLIGVKRINSMK